MVIDNNAYKKQLANTKTFILEDGRTIAYLETGKPDGIPVVVLHGSPMCRMLYGPWVEDAISRGLRLIGYDRPGYGESTPLPGRSVAIAADDVAALAQHLGLSKFMVWGISGGGPHALACAARLPDLVIAAAALAPVAPYQAEGLDWWDGMGTTSYAEFTAALRGRDVFMQDLSGAPSYYASTDAVTFYDNSHSTLPPVEAAAFTQIQADFFLDSTRESLKVGLDGWVDDDIAFTRPWDFQLRQISIPVLIIQGDQDAVVPFGHGKWLASKIKNAESHFFTGEGHFDMMNHVPEVHSWLLKKMK
jgi:pimeloyl-ACP methyl ester carboxylesterase